MNSVISQAEMPNIYSFSKVMIRAFSGLYVTLNLIYFGFEAVDWTKQLLKTSLEAL